MNLRMIIRLPTMTEANDDEENNTKVKNRECQEYVCNR